MKFNIRRIIVIVVLVIGVISAVAIGANLMKPKPKYNLILISVDTLRPDHMGVYGYPKNTTPNIDAWAKNATVFTNMRTQVPTTYPSFSILMTGKNAFENGIYNNFGVVNGRVLEGGHPLDKSVVTLAEILKKSNYKTGAFVANFILDSKYTNLNKGFDTYYVNENSSEESESFNVLQKSLKWIDENRNNKIFLWIHLNEPHAPYTPPKDFQCKFNSDQCSLIKQKTKNDIKNELETLYGCREIPEDKLKLYESLYDAEIATADDIFAQIISRLSRTGLDKKSLVVFYGDHGEGMDHNYYFAHNQNLYESHIKIPFIIKRPSQKSKKINTQLQNTQIFVTLLKLLGVNYIDKKTKDFSDLFSLISEDPKPKYFYSVNSDLIKYSIQENNVKFIYSLPGACLFKSQTEELYNLKEDPNELTNLIGKEKETAKRLKKELFNYLASFNLPAPLKGKNNIGSEQKDIIEKLKSLGY